jgi:hypothetical protein
MSNKHNKEAIEKVRQEIMRFRELLNIMTQQLQHAEQSYTALFDKCSDEDKKTLKEKDLQWKAAELNIDDLEPLSRAVLKVSFNARYMERDFTDLYNIIITPHVEDE